MYLDNNEKTVMGLETGSGCVQGGYAPVYCSGPVSELIAMVINVMWLISV